MKCQLGGARQRKSRRDFSKHGKNSQPPAYLQGKDSSAALPRQLNSQSAALSWALWLLPTKGL